MFAIRPATVEEVAIIATQRRSMFRDMGHRDDDLLDAMVAAFVPWLQRKMEGGEYLGWLAIAGDGEVVAGAGLWLMDWPPHLIGPGSRRGNIVNVYTRLDHRRRGLARRLMETAIDWCRTHGIGAVILHASDDGRALYRALGFQSTNEMRLIVRATPTPLRHPL